MGFPDMSNMPDQQVPQRLVNIPSLCLLELRCVVTSTFPSTLSLCTLCSFAANAKGVFRNSVWEEKLMRKLIHWLWMVFVICIVSPASIGIANEHLNVQEDNIGAYKTGTEYRSVICSPDCRHMAYIAEHGEKQFVVLDGHPGPLVDSIYSFFQCPSCPPSAPIASMWRIERKKVKMARGHWREAWAAVRFYQ